MDQYKSPQEAQGYEGLPTPMFCSPIKQEPKAAGRGVGAILLPGPGKDPLLLGEWLEGKVTTPVGQQETPNLGEQGLRKLWCPGALGLLGLVNPALLGAQQLMSPVSVG